MRYSRLPTSTKASSCTANLVPALLSPKHRRPITRPRPRPRSEVTSAFQCSNFETETDVNNSNLTDRLHYGNPKWFRLWEVAGSSHYDYYGLAIGPDDTGSGQGAVKNLAAMQNPTRTPVGGFNCAVPINTGGTHWALDAA